MEDATTREEGSGSDLPNEEAEEAVDNAALLLLLPPAASSEGAVATSSNGTRGGTVTTTPSGLRSPSILRRGEDGSGSDYPSSGYLCYCCRTNQPYGVGIK